MDETDSTGPAAVPAARDAAYEPASGGEHSRFQILSLDGGGIRGLYSAVVLAALEADTGVRIAEAFDLVAGTSTGGIIALALGAGMTPGEIVEFYAKFGPRIFPHGAARRSWRRIRHWVRPKHDSETLKMALIETFGDRPLARSNLRLVVPAYNLREREVYLFKTPHHPRYRRDGIVPMWKVALATAAAPTYLAGCTEVDGIPLVDGGVWANNPVVVAIVEAVALLETPLDGVRAFSLGTANEVWTPPKKLLNRGLLAWSRAGIDAALGGQAHGASGQAELLLGRDRYLRAAPLVPKDFLALDTHRLADLESRARVDSRKLSPDFVRLFGGHRARAYVPLTHDKEGACNGGSQPGS